MTTMYFDKRWERDFSEGRSDTRHEPTWLIILVLLVGPLLSAAVTVWVSIQFDMSEHLYYLGAVGAFP
jgi:hypothetical protein